MYQKVPIAERVRAKDPMEPHNSSLAGPLRLERGGEFPISKSGFALPRQLNTGNTPESATEEGSVEPQGHTSWMYLGFGPAHEAEARPEQAQEAWSIPRSEVDVALQGKFGTASATLPAGGEQPSLQSGLPQDLKSGVEALSGLSLDRVKVFYNSSKPAQLHALAYTRDNEIHVGPGQETHLAHEAWHVVQQAQGRVKPTTWLGGTAVNDAHNLEEEADRMGGLALTSQPSEGSKIRGPESVQLSSTARVTQRKITFDKEEKVQQVLLKPPSSRVRYKKKRIGRSSSGRNFYRKEMIETAFTDKIYNIMHDLMGKTYHEAIAYLIAETHAIVSDSRFSQLDKAKQKVILRKIGQLHEAVKVGPAKMTQEEELDALVHRYIGILDQWMVSDEDERLSRESQSVMYSSGIGQELELEDDSQQRLAASMNMEQGFDEDRIQIEEESQVQSLPPPPGLKLRMLPLGTVPHPDWIFLFSTKTEAVYDADTVPDLRRMKTYVEQVKKTWSGLKGVNYNQILLSSASNLLLSPSSSAYYLDERELTSLSHGSREDASVYHRSANHPMFAGIHKSDRARVLSSMVVKGTAIKPKSKGSGGEAHVGLYPNSFSYLRNLSARGKDKKALVPASSSVVPKTEDEGQGDLYDETLLYKLSLCNKVASETGGLTYLKVGVFHDYPLVMVHFDLSGFMAGYGKALKTPPTDGTKKAFTQFLMNYYLGLANYFAKSAGVNITMVERSSFGFNTPSIAETGESFRLNLGLMPPIYAHVQAHALHLLDAQLQDVMKNKIARDSSTHGLDTDADYFASKKSDIDAIDDWLTFALYPIEARSKPSISNAVRKRENLDFVNAESFNSMAREQGKVNNLGPVLASLFKKMDVGTSLTTEVDPEKAKYLYHVPAKANPYASDKVLESHYETLLALVRSKLQTVAKSEGDLALRKRLTKISKLIHPENPHIEATLDLANELLLVHAIKQVESLSPDEDSQGDGYGSESEVEDEDEREQDRSGIEEEVDIGSDMQDALPSLKPEKRLLAGKKIITHNGMRALLSAIHTSVKVVYEGKGKLQVDVQGAYYEMDDALKAANIQAEVAKSPDKAGAIVRDINGCVTDGKKPVVATALADSPAQSWIIDTTSATQTQMKALVDAFRDSKAIQLFLVSSGFKQEQFGSDRNQYGTIRTFTDKDQAGKERIEDILAEVRKTDKPLAITSHIYRRLMKKIGAVPRNVSVLSGSKAVTEPSKQSIGSTKWDQFDFSFLTSQVESAQRQSLLDAFIAGLAEVPEQEDDVGAHLADHSHQAHEFIHAGSSAAKKTAAASGSWFQIKRNLGGGDCLLYALAGRNLSFDEVLDLRDHLSQSMGAIAPDHVSGSFVYQSLHQSGFVTRDLHEKMQGKHQIPKALYQSAIKVPGLYAGEEEIQAYCHYTAIQNIYLVTSQGELRQVTQAGNHTLSKVEDVGKAAFLAQINGLILDGNLVLYKSDNHWERIEAVKQELEV